jgi:hypothetical protein
MVASHDSDPVMSSGRAKAPAATARTPKPTPIATLVAGPATAMRSSAAAEGGSLSSIETPPNIHSVMPFTATPSRRATTAWASSWVTSDAKKTTAATAAVTQ